MKKKIGLSLSSILCSFLIILVIYVIIAVSNLSNINVNAADQTEYTVIVEKISTVTVYLTGEEVTLESSELSRDTYKVKNGTVATLRCVNEMRIFEQWIINKGESNEKTINDPVYTISENDAIDVTNENGESVKTITVETVRRETTVDDIGRYMYNNFVISEAEHLIAIQKILDNVSVKTTTGTNQTTYSVSYNTVSETNKEELITCYDYFFSTYDKYKNATDKIAAINQYQLHKIIQYGYYNVIGSIALMSDEFSGIGNSQVPFRGVMCGDNDATNSEIILTINSTEGPGIECYGLFGVIDEEAVVRHLNVTAFIGISAGKIEDYNASGKQEARILIGAVAGLFNNALLYQVEAGATIGVDTKYSNVYAGGIAGFFRGGLSAINQVSFSGVNHSWGINTTTIEDTSTSASHNISISAGYIAGKVSNILTAGTYSNKNTDYPIYFKDLDIHLGSSSIKVTDDSTYASDIYTGNLIGNLVLNDDDIEIDNIHIINEGQATIKNNILTGNSYAGGLIGYVNAAKQKDTNGNDLDLGKLTIGYITIQSKTGIHEIISQNKNSLSKANVYAGGLIGYIQNEISSNGTTIESNVVAGEEFKNSFEEYEGNEEFYDIEYIFSGNVKVKAIQNGIKDSATYGKCIAAGICAYGLFDINGILPSGTIAKDATQLMMSDGGAFEVSAIQSSSSKTTYYTNYVDGIDHCIASLVFGLVSTDNITNDFESINIYANGANVTATREKGSFGSGDVRASGFIGYINGSNVTDVNLFINDSKITVDSLSYEIVNPPGGNKINNVYCGGLIAQAEGTGNIKPSLTNINLGGYNKYNPIQIYGTNLKIRTIQNTPQGNNDTRCENYTGGIVGFVDRVKTIDYCNYYGSETTEDEIIMQCHENPNSAFIGGIVGFIWDNTNGNTYNITNSSVVNATVKGYATSTLDSSAVANPDLYVGGIVGASYKTSGISNVHTYNNLLVYNSDIHASGTERMQAYSGGIIGGITWSGTQNFTKCYVFKTTIYAESNYASEISTGENQYHGNAFAAGVCAHNTGTASMMNECAIIDSKINAQSSKTYATAVGFMVRYTKITPSLSNCFINSEIVSNGSGTSQGIGTAYGKHLFINGGTYNANDSAKRNYYTSTMPLTGVVIAKTENIITLSDLEITTTTQLTSITDQLDGDKFYPQLTNAESGFVVSNAGVSKTPTIGINNTVTSANDFLEIWVNVTTDNTVGMSPPENEVDAAEAGWFKLGTVSVSYNRTQSDAAANANSTDIKYLYNNEEFRYVENGNGKLQNVKYENEIIDSGYIESVITPTDVVLGGTGGNTYSYKYDITAKVYNGIPSIRFKTIVLDDTLYSPIFYSGSGAKLNVTGNEILGGYGTFDFSFEKVTVDNKNGYLYTISFHPNVNLSSQGNLEMFITLAGDASANYWVKQSCKITIVPNKKELIGVETASYSPSLNYYETDLGTEEKPYIFREGAVIKLIPVYTLSNDLEKVTYNDDTNIEFVNYTMDSITGLKMNSNGELVIGSNITDAALSAKYSITVTLKDNSDSEIVYFQIAGQTHSVTYSSTGSDVSANTYASSAVDFEYKINKYSNYSSIPNVFKITIGSTEYDFIQKQNETVDSYNARIKGYIDSGFSVKSNSNTIIGKSGSTYFTEFTEGNASYDVVIPKGLIVDKINIEAGFVVVYEIKLLLKNESFYPEYEGQTSKSFYITSGTVFRDYFYDEVINDDGTVSYVRKPSLSDTTWIENGTLFGYLFNGFYLVDDANNMKSYGKSLSEIVSSDTKVSTNMTFYASWSFLVELVEAPGTEIKSSFPDDFMKVHYDTTENGQNEAIKIPINNNKGYVFTISKNDDFLGEVSVRAFSATRKYEQVDIEEITVEKYHDNMYLYYIPPEKIKGYLVIQTSISNSEVIVGENTSKVVDEVLPTDGIYTYKYVINHNKQGDEQSFMYNYVNKAGNENVDKNFKIAFFKQSYNPMNKYLECISADGSLRLYLRDGEMGDTVTATQTTYYFILENGGNDTTLTSQKFSSGIDTVELYYQKNQGSTDVYVSGNESGVFDSPWTRVANAVLTSDVYDKVTYTFGDTNDKYFKIDNQSLETKHLLKVVVTDKDNQTYTIDLNEQKEGYHPYLSCEYSNGITAEERFLYVGTIIEVYYQMYVDGELVDSRVGTNAIEKDEEGKISSLLLSDFVDYDGYTKTFEQMKLKDFLGTEDRVISEVYYFSITPTNGLSYELAEPDAEYDEMNYCIHSGYCDNNGEFIVGERNSNYQVQNKPLDGVFENMTVESAMQENAYTVTNSRTTSLEYSGSGKDYIFTDISRYGVMKLYAIDGDADASNGYLALYDSRDQNTILETKLLSPTREVYFKDITFTAYYGVGTVNIYGGVSVTEDGVRKIKWDSLAIPVQIDTYNEKEYTVDISDYDYKYFKIDNVSGSEIRIKDLVSHDKITGLDLSIDFSKKPTPVIEEGNITYHIYREIVGDNRHNGKKFMLAIQFKDSQGNVEELHPNGVSIKINGTTQVLPLDNDKYGKLVAFFNLSDFVSHGNETITVTIEHMHTELQLYVQLLEVANTSKPGMGEVRVQYVDHVETQFRGDLLFGTPHH